MNESSVYKKTEKGANEVANQSGALSMRERRVLILLNGSAPVSEVRKKSLVEEFDSILENLVSGEFIEMIAAGESAPPADANGPLDLDAPRELMLNTLKAFGNQMRTSNLLSDIEAASALDELKELVSRWYQAISETPNGMYQVDDLKKDLDKLLGP